VPYKPKKPKAKFKPNQTAPELYKIEKMEEVYLREYVHACHHCSMVSNSTRFEILQSKLDVPVKCSKDIMQSCTINPSFHVYAHALHRSSSQSIQSLSTNDLSCILLVASQFIWVIEEQDDYYSFRPKKNRNTKMQLKQDPLFYSFKFSCT
jgi:hypothetical protein